MLRELRALNKIPGQILHLWTTPPASSFKDTRVEIIERGFYSLLFLAQALGEQDFINNIDITIVSTRELHETTSEETCAEKAMLLGPCKVIPQEFTNITCKSIDVLPSETVEPSARLVEQILSEAADGSLSKAFEPLVSYRGAVAMDTVFRLDPG